MAMAAAAETAAMAEPVAEVYAADWMEDASPNFLLLKMNLMRMQKLRLILLLIKQVT